MRAIVLVACLSGTPSAWEQDARDVFDEKVRPGDKLTVLPEMAVRSKAGSSMVRPTSSS